MNTYVEQWDKATEGIEIAVRGMNDLLDNYENRPATHSDNTTAIDIRTSMATLRVAESELKTIKSNVVTWLDNQNKAICGCDPLKFKSIGSLFLTMGTGIATYAIQVTDKMKHTNYCSPQYVNWAGVACQTVFGVFTATTLYFGQAWRKRNQLEAKAHNILNAKPFIDLMQLELRVYEKLRSGHLTLILSPAQSGIPQLSSLTDGEDLALQPDEEKGTSKIRHLSESGNQDQRPKSESLSSSDVRSIQALFANRGNFSPSNQPTISIKKSTEITLGSPKQPGSQLTHRSSYAGRSPSPLQLKQFPEAPPLDVEVVV